MMNRNRGASRARQRGGFTLIELLVVITIILIISAVALPTILPALSHRQVSEAARIFQGALVGARDSAIHNNAPSGVRLLPDPVLNGLNPQTGLLDPSQPLAANRFIPLELAPEYSEGAVSSLPTILVPANFQPCPWLAVMESVVYASAAGAVLPNSPTSWFWNIRVGDKIQINGAGPWYTVVGPMVIQPLAVLPANRGNTELFVNVGPPGTQSPLNIVQGGQNGLAVNPEFLFLVNGQDDNGNGWIDESFDGVDNNANGVTDYPADPVEFEQEAWLGSVGVNGFTNQLYTIQRRPAPAINARATSLPSNVVIDLTTWGATPTAPATLERTRLPGGAFNPYTGYVDILVYPNGTVVPTTIYSTPASVGLSGSFFHFWLAERSDVVAPVGTGAPLLPIGNIQQSLSQPPYNGTRIQGEYRLVTVFTRTGQTTTAEDVQFDNPAFEAANNSAYNASYPFLAAQQGVTGAP